MSKNKKFLLVSAIVYTVFVIAMFIYDNPFDGVNPPPEYKSLTNILSVVIIALLIVIHISIYRTSKEQDRKASLWTFSPLIFLTASMAVFMIGVKNQELTKKIIPVPIFLFFFSFTVISILLLLSNGWSGSYNKNRSSIRQGNNLLWKCPECGAVLQKNSDTNDVLPLLGLSSVAGTATCGNCGMGFSIKDVYSGKYDV